MQRQSHSSTSRSIFQPGHINNTYPTDISQHGLQSFMLAVPAEALGHITAYLDPPALLSLSKVNRLLYEYIENDVIWLRAFLVYFFAIGPEIDVERVIATVPRLKSTWRDEYISRYKLVRRWQHSRAATITHAPQWAPITLIHVMVDGAALLSASVLQGVIARSHVLTGKKFKGFIDSAGALVQRPNGNHSIPAVMTLASDGGTGKGAWGFYNGDVSYTRMPHVMGLGAPRHSICLPEDAHSDAVTCLEFSQNGHVLASASADGSVKLWGTRHFRCFWTYTPPMPLDQRDPCTRILLHIPSGTVIVGMRSGRIMLWTGFGIDVSGDTFNTHNITSITIPAPLAELHTTLHLHSPAAAIVPHSISTKSASLALLCKGESRIRKIDVNFDDPANFNITMSSPNSHGILTAIRCTSTSPAFSSFITGDRAGWLQIWDASTLERCKAWSAHDDGSITVLEITEYLLATGSGSIIVWDALTHQKLRSFPTPVPRNLTHVGGDDVTCLALSEESVVGCVGNRVVGWRVDHGVRLLGLASKGKRKGGTARYISPKWQGQIEMKKAIVESYEDDYKATRDSLSGLDTHEHRNALHELGLEEREALEYVLMLSRDEEEERQRQQISSSLDSISSIASISSHSLSDNSDIDLGSNSPPVPDGDLEHQEIFTMTPIPSPRVSPVLMAQRSSPQSRAVHTDSNEKIQVTPPFRAEALEASASPSAFWLDDAIAIPKSHIMKSSDFPYISSPSSPSPRPSVPANSSTPSQSVNRQRKPKISESAPKVVKTWSAVVRTPQSAEGLENGSPAIALSSHLSISNANTLMPHTPEDEEEMLRLALQASLTDM